MVICVHCGDIWVIGFVVKMDISSISICLYSTSNVEMICGVSAVIRIITRVPYYATFERMVVIWFCNLWRQLIG